MTIRPSRLMPTITNNGGLPRIVRAVVMLTLAIGGVWLLWTWPLQVLGLIAVLAIWGLVDSRREKVQLQALTRGRAGKPLDGFVKSLPIRELDTWVVRAVFEQISDHVRVVAYPEFPLRPSDRLTEDLRIDPEDLEDIVVVIAQRTRRSLNDYKTNPHYQKLTTVEDLIRFFCAQPMAT